MSIVIYLFIYFLVLLLLLLGLHECWISRLSQRAAITKKKMRHKQGTLTQEK